MIVTCRLAAAAQIGDPERVADLIDTDEAERLDPASLGGGGH